MCVCVYVCVGEGLLGWSLCGIRRLVRCVLQDQRGAEWPPRVPTSGGEGQRLPDTPAVDLQFRQRRVVVGLGLVAQRPRRRGPLLGVGQRPQRWVRHVIGSKWHRVARAVHGEEVLAALSGVLRTQLLPVGGCLACTRRFSVCHWL